MKYINADLLARWLDAHAAQGTVIAPVSVDGVLLYRPIRSSAEVVWHFTRPVMSIKECFFPITERMMTLTMRGPSVDLAETLPEEEAILFGVRPCDARGMLALDALFLTTPPVDPYYAARRRNTTLIGIACEQMGETCFCDSVGGAPDDPTGLDLMLTEQNGGYAVEAITEKGAALMATMILDDIPGKRPRLEPKDRRAVPMPADWLPHFVSEYWAEQSERCLSCRACAYVCPTCRCFDVKDEALPTANGDHAYERLRCWDSCMREAYRQIAGGHNPRQAKADRLRNRVFCKFQFYAEQYGASACTGCGRCIDACPVNIDITEIVSHLAEVSR